MFRRLPLWMLLVAAWVPGPRPTIHLHAQDSAPSSASEPLAPASIGLDDPQLQYEQTLNEWKTLLKQMRALRVQRQTAPDSQLPELQRQWAALIQQGRDRLPVLREHARNAFQAAPNADPHLNRFLVEVLTEYVEQDRYEQAFELGRVLIDGQCNLDVIYNLTGIAAFSVNEFELAKQYLDTAVKKGVITEEAHPMLVFADDVRLLWEEEQKLRQADAESNLPRVKLTTSRGDMVLELFEDQAPDTVGNFVHLVEQGFYDGLTFHRVIAGHIAQGGCPEGTGFGDAGYKIYCETDRDDHRKHFRGSLSMAKQTPKNTGGSQFFLCYRPAPYLNGEHTVFGRIVEGMDVLASLQRRDPEKDSAAAAEPDEIIKAEVLRKRDHPYVPNKVQ